MDGEKFSGQNNYGKKFQAVGTTGKDGNEAISRKVIMRHYRKRTSTVIYQVS